MERGPAAPAAWPWRAALVGVPSATRGGSSGGSSEFMYPQGCPQPNPTAAKSEQVIAIQSVNFDTSEMVVRNISGENLVLEGGAQGWQWCNIPGYGPILEEDVTLEPGQTLAFPLIFRGALRPLYPGDEIGDANELAIYSTTGSFMTAQLMAAFVSWGSEGLRAGAGRESVAVTAGLWTFGHSVEIRSGHSGFIATGRQDLESGYTSVPRRCLVTPPNPPGAQIPRVE